MCSLEHLIFCLCLAVRNYRLLSKFEASLSYYVRPCLREKGRERRGLKFLLFYKPGLSFSFLNSAVNNTPDRRDRERACIRPGLATVSQSNDQIRTVPTIPLKHIQICPGKMGKVTSASQKYTSVTVTCLTNHVKDDLTSWNSPNCACSQGHHLYSGRPCMLVVSGE